MPSRAWVVTYCDTDSAKVINRFNALSGLSCYACGWDSGRGIKAFQCPLGLELLQKMGATTKFTATVSMPSRAWVVTIPRRPLHLPVLRFNALSGLSCYAPALVLADEPTGFNALSGLSCYAKSIYSIRPYSRFNALSGLSCYCMWVWSTNHHQRFNALSGLSCYGKNVQYFKFFMMLFMHTCYL